MQALLPEGYPVHQFNLYKGVKYIALIIFIRKIHCMSKTNVLLLIHSRQALNNLKYAVRSWEGGFTLIHRQRMQLWSYAQTIC